MAMPDDLIIIRHGESEANVAQAHLYNEQSQKIELIKKFSQNPDHHVRLTKTGVLHAHKAGDWLKKNKLDKFDRYYTSPHVRTQETAANLMIDGDWRIDDRLREQNWGEYNLLSWDEVGADSPASLRIRQQNYWYWRPRGGETLAGDVRTRFESFLTTLHRKAVNDRVVAMSHGGWMQTARFVLERLTPDEWFSQVESKEYTLWNCQILHYSKTNPATGEKEPYLRWRRSICPWDNSRSWNGGEWVEINSKKLSDKELLRAVAKYKSLLPKELLQN